MSVAVLQTELYFFLILFEAYCNNKIIVKYDLACYIEDHLTYI
jgi:hypothetical protein